MNTPTLKQIALAAALATCITLPAAAQTPSEPWLVRIRAVGLISDNKDSTGLDLSVSDKVLPEVDISYFFTPEFAAELVLTYPQKHSIRAGDTHIGSLHQLPPTLLAQYHFTQLGALKPYVGIGLNYTNISKVHFTPGVVAALHPSVDHSSFGLALQVGVDFEIAKNVYLNFDVKHVDIETDVKSSGTKVGKFKIDPWLIGVGVGYRF
jgi:outer membrane protein